METFRMILIAIYIILSIITIIYALTQAKEDAGMESTVTTASNENYIKKNKGKTQEGKQKKIAVAMIIVWVVLTIVLGIVMMI